MLPSLAQSRIEGMSARTPRFDDHARGGLIVLRTQDGGGNGLSRGGLHLGRRLGGGRAQRSGVQTEHGDVVGLVQ